MKIVQLLPTIVLGDAVSNHARAIRRLLEPLCDETEIYAENISPALPPDTAQPVALLPALGAEDVLIYHMSTGSPVSERVEAQCCRKVMIYHNVTPPEFIAPYSRRAADVCRAGQEELRRLADVFDYCLPVSEFNRRDLLAAGYACPTDVCPIVIPFEEYDAEPDRRVLEQTSDGRTNILFVGRIVPNKKQEDIIRAFACYQQRYDPTARLILAGSDAGMEKYRRRLWDYTRALGARNVVFTGHISFAELLAYYRTAHAFLCMSGHEGFCVPILEAMHFGVPVLACAAGAVPETLHGSGILLESRDAEYCAGELRRLLTDRARREEILAGQARRLADFAPERVSALFTEKLSAFLARPAAPHRPRVIQMVPVLSWGDAISNDVLALRRVFREMGLRESVWSWQMPAGKLRRDVHWGQIPPVVGREDVAVFHMGIGSEMSEAFLALPCRKVVVYHNVTPAAFFEPYSKPMARGCRMGLRQAKRLAQRADYCLADSEFNRQDLLAMGCRCPTDVLPILIPYADYDQAPDEDTLARYSDGRTNILFVGRLVPNKKIENVVRAFACYQQRYDPAARLILAGAGDTVEGYVSRLEEYIRATGAENVVLTGKIPFPQLLAYYRTAHIFLCMSEHEGFCVPLLEAMYFNVPVVAYAAAAVPGTLSGSGVLLEDNGAEGAAEAIRALMSDEAYRREILAGQAKRLAELSTEEVSKRAKTLFAAFLGVEEHG